MSFDWTKHAECPSYYDDDCNADRAEMIARGEELEEGIELAWGLIANANGGNWEEMALQWQEAAVRWRDRFLLGKSEAKL